MVKAPTLAYKVAVGPETDGFAANLAIVDEPFGGSLDEYVSSAIDGLGQYFENFQILRQEEFTPEKGPPGVRIVAENVQSGRVLRQRFYLFDAGKSSSSPVLGLWAWVRNWMPHTKEA